MEAANKVLGNKITGVIVLKNPLSWENEVNS